MMFKRMLVLTVALLMILPTITSAKEIKQLREFPLMKLPAKGISSAEQLKKFVETFKDRIKDGFEQAGLPSCYDAFMDAVQNGTPQDKVIPKGQQIPWMLFYHKKVKVSKDVVWAGKKTFDAFAIIVNCDCKDYEFIIPKICGNVSLLNTVCSVPTCSLKVSPAKADVGDPIKVDVSGSNCAETFEITVSLNGKDVDFKKLPKGTTQCEVSFKEPGIYTVTAKSFNCDGVASQGDVTAQFELIKKYPPVCELKVTPTEGYVGQPFKLDASGSSDKDGKVVKADFDVKGPESDAKSVTTVPFVWDKVFKKSGIYDASVQVTDNDGLKSENNCTVTGIKVQKRLYMLADIGGMVAKGTYTGYVFGRLGFAYLIVPEKWDVNVSIGYAVKLAGWAFKNHFLSNLVLNYHMSDFFIGAGVGYSSKVRLSNPKDPVEWKACFNVIGNIGYDVYKAFNKKGSIFAEVRLPVLKGLPIKSAHEILLGFRFLF